MWIVTILILIDGFLQFEKIVNSKYDKTSHNPYFNRWFSAIEVINMKTTLKNKSQSLF